jgi:hypothetical protein
MSAKRILMLGGGFAGLWSAVGAARKLDELGQGPDAVEVTLVNRDAFHGTLASPPFSFGIDRWVARAGIRAASSQHPRPSRQTVSWIIARTDLCERATTSQGSGRLRDREPRPGRYCRAACKSG